MKYIFLFVNPTSGGNKASIFTEFGVNEIIFHKPHKCHFFIYNILEGEKGKKPGFLNLRSITNNPRKFESKAFSSFSKSKSFTDKNNLSLENKDSLIKRKYLSKEKIPTNSNRDSNDKNIDLDKHNEHECEKNKELVNETKCNELNCESKSDRKENELLSKRSNENKDISIYVLVAGGDGTLNWVLKESESYNINNNKFAVGVIPFGTGNDFARAFGWKKIDGIFNHSFLFNILKKIVDQTFKSKIEKHDYWNIEVVLKKDGYFNKINSKTKKKETLKENNENITELKLCMSNYFSIGIDSRIGRGFERHRKKNALCNKIVYAVEGFKKISFKKNIPVNLIIDKMVAGENYDNVIFTTNNSEVYPLLKKSMSIICINIPSYSSGNDIWNYTHKIGLNLPKNLTSDEKKVYDELKKSQQEVGDGILEFVIYQSGIDLGLEFTLKGRAYRVHQGIGPWKIFFKEQKYNVYFQVDGEYYLMSLPNYISICHYKKINVLKNIL
ncbi:diacylglycerol kinase, putative [Plasmodium gallinaceum]|uniref:Diacylglycerol kinase n=1 Tax=Plasmodium gallinaceum TaxID=5849 RepID=A0A1J1GQX2_PLAGA|nr:diacylglycerol kinase, putative [Plasmodium gallinaceum]CRG94912.1 diacylglycerol kinase, putative [Plasmodium gallinaceum]